jgi:hypothetical protein
LISQVGDRCFAYAQHDKNRVTDISLALAITKIGQKMVRFAGHGRKIRMVD